MFKALGEVLNYLYTQACKWLVFAIALTAVLDRVFDINIIKIF